VQSITRRGAISFRLYAAALAEARTSSSFSLASFIQSLAFRSRNFRSCSSLVRVAYHSHCLAFSKQSAIVGDMVSSNHVPRACSLFDEITRSL
jgi:hypothetical protein